MYLSRDQSALHIQYPKSNVTGFAVVDDDRFCITAGNRLMVCEAQAQKHVFRVIAKLPKKPVAMKCYCSSMSCQIDTVMVVFEDDSYGKWPLPLVRDGDLVHGLI
jgi:hypothetical protein